MRPSFCRFSSSASSLSTDRFHSIDHIQLGPANMAAMTPKSRLLGTILLLFACFLLLTPVVQSCFFFYAAESDKGSGYAEVQMFENHTMVCEYSGLPISSSPAPSSSASPAPSSSASPAPSPSGDDNYWVYHLSCSEGYLTTFAVNTATFYGLVIYERPHELLSFEAPGDGGLWQVCEGGCTYAQCKHSG